MQVSVIVPAAGSGKRFGGKENKIFQRLSGRPVFLRTLELFAGREDVAQVLLVVNPSERELIQERFGGHLGLMNVRLVDGGAERVESVRNALACVDETVDLIAVHDAVRPCVSQLWIDEVFAAAETYGAAILAYPVHGTLKKVTQAAVEDDRQPTIMLGGEPLVTASSKREKPEAWVIQQTVPRSGLWQAQTPQVFHRELLMKAYAGDVVEGITDDSQLVEAMGHAVRIVLGDQRNVKITTPRDLAMAAAVIDTLPKPKAKGPDHPFGEAQW